jgi:STE24 endopeptidase
MTSLPSESTLDSQLVLEPASTEVKRYHRQRLVAGIAELVLSLAALIFAAVWAGPRLPSLFPDWIQNSRWLLLLAVGFSYAVVMEILDSPLDIWSGFILEHRYQLSNETFLHWAWQRIKGYLVGGPLMAIALLGCYALLWFAGPWWWVWAAGAWLVFTLVLGQLVPLWILPLFYKVSPLEDSSLQERLRRLAEGTGLNVEGIYRLHLSAETRKANAALAGLGRTRRVFLADTLLESFTPEEIEVVFAHEVGHHVYHHLVQSIALRTGLTLVGLWLVDLVLRLAAPALGYRHFDDPTALPLLLLVMALFGLLLAPAQNALSRFYERQCDRYCLRRTQMPDAFRSAFIKLARLNKADPDTHPLIVWLFHDHPTIRQRVALADAVMIQDPA